MAGNDDVEFTDQKNNFRKNLKENIKIALLLCIWIGFTISLVLNPEYEPEEHLKTLSNDKDFEMVIKGEMLPTYDLFSIVMKGPFCQTKPNKNVEKNMISVKIVDYVSARELSSPIKVHGVWNVELCADYKKATKAIKRSFYTSPGAREFKIIFSTNTNVKTPIKVRFNPYEAPQALTVSLAACCLVVLYVLIIWDLVDRAFAAMLVSTTALAILAWLHARPSIEKIVSWIDMETILLLFGMMILVAISAETGLFDYLAVATYRVARGNAWPMIGCLVILTALVSAFLDNVTMMLLMVPVTIRLCEIMDLNVQNVLIIVVIYSNLGGTMTAVGDPPNVIISSNPDIIANGVTFLDFIAHLAPVILIVMPLLWVQIRYQVGKKAFAAPENMERASKELPKDQALLERIKALQLRYNKRQVKPLMGLKPVENYNNTIAEMEVKYPIRNKVLLCKSTIALGFAVTMFFMNSIPQLKGISMAWAALLAALLLIILTGAENIAKLLHHIEWVTLLFFAALFILMEALAELGLIDWIGQLTIGVIKSVSEDGRLAVAIVIILWITGISSAFVDNIPITTMMVRLCIRVHRDQTLNLPLQPLVWALALGTCLGGNGTIIGASANVITSGIAEHHGYKFTFYQFFKIGFPAMLTSLLISTAYLLVCHVAFSWH